MYEAHFGLREKPFSLLPDPSYLYLSDKHRMALALLQYGLSNQAGFTAITGGIGTGKTTLIRHLLNTMEQDVTVGLISNTHRSFGELLQWILLAFNLSYSGKSKVEMYQAFVDFMIKEYAQNRRTVLIVDEAQNMEAETLEELRMLSNVNADKDQVLQVILVGQQQLRDNLRRPDLVQFAQRIAVDYHLTPLTADESTAYIRHRVAVAGGTAELFTDAACAAVHRFSSGVPRLVNLLCDLSLVYGYAEQRSQIDADLVEDVAREKQAGGIFPSPETPPGNPPDAPAPTADANSPTAKKKLRLAIASASLPLRRYLRQLVEDQGLIVVDDMPLDDTTIDRIDPEGIDILLVDLDENGEDRVGTLCDTLARWNLPVLFNDSQATEASLLGDDPQFGTRLTSKLVSLLPQAVDR
jgi:general secretion pathway protein A